MEKKGYITNRLEETQNLGRELAGQLRGGEIICLDGELGAGKTTFTQGLLAGLGAQGPYTSPTFLIMKEYKIEIRNPKSEIRNNTKIQKSKSRTDVPQTTRLDSRRQPLVDARRANQKPQTIYHIDAYRIAEDDLLNLGWEEILENKNNTVIIEWPERVRKIIPKEAIEIKFEWIMEDQRKITFV